MQLKDKAALITEAASGIGLSIAQRFAAVVLVDREAAEIRAQNQQAHFVPANLAEIVSAPIVCVPARSIPLHCILILCVVRGGDLSAIDHMRERGYLTTPEQLAATGLYLVSDESSAITGSIVVADAGARLS